ncbi:MAG: NADH-quinone oxidoreductase subunit N, partial [Alphaproteobacteria bacterium]|nr:NADH-quinone oxidoreductase subunit N [Alphaproteobacteria bacterium]
MSQEIPTMLPAVPEIFLAVAGMVLMMLGVFTTEKRAYKTVSTFSVLTLLVALLLVVFMYKGRAVAFSDMFVVDGFAVFMKVLVIVGSAVTLIMSDRYLRREDMTRFEYPILVLFATLGMMMMISANDLIALYVGLELQSLSLYIVAAFQRDSVRSTEAGLKYFVLGAISSGLLLYGASMVYGFTGATGFDDIATALTTTVPGNASAEIGILIGLVFVAAALAFKVSAVPFHMWTPDVYEGAPTPVTAFFSAAPKVAAIALLLRVFLGPFHELASQWDQIIIFVSVASMALGAFAAIGQKNIKRLMAYSSIGHVGYALVGLS